MSSRTPSAPSYDLLAAFLVFLACLFISLLDKLQGLDINAFAGLN